MSLSTSLAPPRRPPRLRPLVRQCLFRFFLPLSSSLPLLVSAQGRFLGLLRVASDVHVMKELRVRLGPEKTPLRCGKGVPGGCLCVCWNHWCIAFENVLHLEVGGTG